MLDQPAVAAPPVDREALGPEKSQSGGADGGVASLPHPPLLGTVWRLLTTDGSARLPDLGSSSIGKRYTHDTCAHVSLHGSSAGHGL